ncbi:dynein light chain [Ceratocystis lukuohia]|uniref:Dynein light chain n=1 Tax=Ceratocystis lukuohia TaxID=2019550 RepID=A0ABR4M8W2_9PEZI
MADIKPADPSSPVASTSQAPGPNDVKLEAQAAMQKYTIEKDIAQHIKKTFDDRKGPTWHCIVGRNFGSFVTHGHCAILLFKTQ